MPTTAMQWNLQVPTELDADLREFLKQERGSATEADVAAFVEDAVRDRIFDLTCQRVKARNTNLDPKFIEDVVDEALKWATRQ
jgi:hypothetical protein